MSSRFACGAILLGAFCTGTLSIVVLQLLWLTIAAFVVAVVAAGVFFILSLE